MTESYTTVRVGHTAPDVDLLDHIRRSKARVTLLTGRNGVGKTMVLNELRSPPIAWMSDEAEVEALVAQAFADDRRPVTGGSGLAQVAALIRSVRACGRTLCVDNIETEIHFAVWSHLWPILAAECQRRDVRLVASTHSSDVIEWLLRSVVDGLIDADDVQIIRLDHRGGKRVAFVFGAADEVARNDFLCALELR